MKDGFYWGKFADDIQIDGAKAGIVYVVNDTGYLYGFAFKLSAYDFGDDPEPVDPPQWLIDKLMVGKL